MDTSRVISDLCIILTTLIPPAAPASRAGHVQRRPTRVAQISPAEFASLLFGASFALMLSGSVTFMLGFMLMPWVFGFVIVFWFCGVVSNLNSMCRGVFCCPMNRPTEGQVFPKIPII